METCLSFRYDSSIKLNKEEVQYDIIRRTAREKDL